MDWTQTFTIIGVNIGVLGVFTAVLLWFLGKVDSDIKGVSERVDKLGTRLDGHAQRIDQLYKMFIDLLKERKNP